MVPDQLPAQQPFRYSYSHTLPEQNILISSTQDYVSSFSLIRPPHLSIQYSVFYVPIRHKTTRSVPMVSVFSRCRQFQRCIMIFGTAPSGNSDLLDYNIISPVSIGITLSGDIQEIISVFCQIFRKVYKLCIEIIGHYLRALFQPCNNVIIFGGPGIV